MALQIFILRSIGAGETYFDKEPKELEPQVFTQRFRHGILKFSSHWHAQRRRQSHFIATDMPILPVIPVPSNRSLFGWRLRLQSWYLYFEASARLVPRRISANSSFQLPVFSQFSHNAGARRARAVMIEMPIDIISNRTIESQPRFTGGFCQ